MTRLSAVYGMSAIAVRLEEPRDVMVSEDRAYVVVPIEVRWRQKGTPDERAGAITTALRERHAGWRITTCASTWK